MVTRQLLGDTTVNDHGHISRSLDCFTSNFSKTVCMASFNIVTRRPECRPVAHLCRPVQCQKTYFTNQCVAAFSEVQKYVNIKSFRGSAPDPTGKASLRTALPRPPSWWKGWAAGNGIALPRTPCTLRASALLACPSRGGKGEKSSRAP